MKTTFLYTLSDPETGKIRYLGKSDNPFKRYRAHLKDREPSHKTNWILGLKTKGFVPYMDLLDEIPVSQWQFWEREYIRVFRAIGLPLTNQCEGGENPPSNAGKKRPDFGPGWRAKISASRKGRFAGLNSSRFGAKNSPQHRERISKSKIGKPVPQAVLQAAVVANTGKKRSPKFGAQIVKAQTGFTRAATGQFKRMPYFSGGGGI